jgi:hypothetical protein
MAVAHYKFEPRSAGIVHKAFSIRTTEKRSETIYD